MKKRGNLGNHESNELAKQIFHICEHNGEIKTAFFITTLIEFGIPLSENVIKATLSKLFHTNSVDTYSITENDMIALCKNDSFTNNLLDILLESSLKLVKTLNPIQITDTNQVENENYNITLPDIEKLLKS